IKDLYQGSSISGGNRCARWSLGSEKRLFGCDRSAMFIHQLSLGRTAVYDLLDDSHGQVVTAFGSSALRNLNGILPQPMSSAACKLSYIGLDVVPQYEVSENSNIWNICLAVWKSAATWQNR